MPAAKEPQYLVQVQKVTSLSGESITVNFNMPQSTTEETLYAEVSKVCGVLDRRLLEQNEKILALTEATKIAFDQELAEENKPTSH